MDSSILLNITELMQIIYVLALPNSGDQVGFSIALQPLFRGGLWGDPITQYATDIMCHCHYNPQRLPPKPVIDTNKCSIPIFCNLFDPPLPNTSLSYREGKTGFGLPTMTNWFDFAHNWKCYKNIVRSHFLLYLIFWHYLLLIYRMQNLQNYGIDWWDVPIVYTIYLVGFNLTWDFKGTTTHLHWHLQRKDRPSTSNLCHTNP